jgi:hypothetical protein
MKAGGQCANGGRRLFSVAGISGETTRRGRTQLLQGRGVA